jgi:shikimate dehydrogenase
MTDRYAVFGNPIAHSKSPLIHAEFARQTGQDMVYEARLAPLSGFVAEVERFRAEGGKGANVTVPFKVEAFHYARVCTERARQAGAVNTLKFDGDVVLGDNTDGAGLVRDITVNLGEPIRGRRVLLVGAGGAARGVVHPLLAQGPAFLFIANRTVDKARALAQALTAEGPVAAGGFADLGAQSFDLVINATSAGLADELPPLPETVFSTGALAYDMVYGRPTPFMAFAHRCGARVADGLGMLVEQAAESFFLWRGVRPDTAPVIELLRKT